MDLSLDLTKTIIDDVKVELISILDELSAPYANRTYVEYEGIHLIHNVLEKYEIDKKTKINNINIIEYVMKKVVDHLVEICRCK